MGEARPTAVGDVAVNEAAGWESHCGRGVLVISLCCQRQALHTRGGRTTLVGGDEKGCG